MSINVKHILKHYFHIIFIIWTYLYKDCWIVKKYGSRKHSVHKYVINKLKPYSVGVQCIYRSYIFRILLAYISCCFFANLAFNNVKNTITAYQYYYSVPTFNYNIFIKLICQDNMVIPSVKWSKCQILCVYYCCMIRFLT